MSSRAIASCTADFSNLTSSPYGIALFRGVLSCRTGATPLSIAFLASSSSGMVTTLTMTYAEDAIGVTCATQSAKIKIPAIISFTVKMDGKLPSGQTLKEAIETVGEATDAGPVYYIIKLF